jgi:sugar phosphate isomerase/epimerase
MKDHSIAAQLYTLREYMKTPQGIEESLRKVKQVGYRAVQVSGIGPIEAERLKSITDELDLRICATHISFERLQNELNEVIQTHQLWNCDYVGVGMMPKAYQTSVEGYQAFIRELAAIGRTLKDNGLHLMYHHHNFEFERFGEVTGMDLLLEGAGPDTYSLEIDTYWVQAGGGSPAEWIRKADGVVKVVHLKDMAVKGWNQKFAEIGQGNLNWNAIIEASRDSGVEWYVVEQDECERNPFESLAMSLDYLRTLAHQPVVE